MTASSPAVYVATVRSMYAVGLGEFVLDTGVRVASSTCSTTLETSGVC